MSWTMRSWTVARKALQEAGLRGFSPVIGDHKVPPFADPRHPLGGTPRKSPAVSVSGGRPGDFERLAAKAVFPSAAPVGAGGAA